MTASRFATKSLYSALLAGILTCAAPAQTSSTDGDKQFLTVASQGDFNEIRLSQLAQTKSSNPQVKAFANKMIADHNKLETQLVEFARKWDVAPANEMDAEHQGIYDHLNGLSGPDFDKAYLTAMAADHHKALDAFTAEAQSAQDSHFRSTVSKGRKVVAAHTTMADDLLHKM